MRLWTKRTRKSEDHDNAVALAAPRAPAGFCPKCGYPIDPGRCSECGLEVTAATLARIPPRLRFRRRVRLAIIAALLIGLPFGGYRFYRDVAWERWLPNGAVLWLGERDWDRANAEALRRCAAGQFSASEVDRLFRGAYKITVEYAPRIPANTSMPVWVIVEPRGPLGPSMTNTYYSPRHDDWLVAGDGWRLTLPAEQAMLRFETPPLPPGQHQLTITGNFWHAQSLLPGMPPRMSWPVRLPVSFTVEDRPMSDFVRPRWSPELADAVQKCVRVKAQAPLSRDIGGRDELYMVIKKPPLPLAFEVFVRSSPEAEYVPLLDSMGLPENMCCRRGATFGTNGPRLPPDCSRIDVQLRPAPTQALFRGFEECFDGTLEWRDLPISAFDGAYPPDGLVSPTRVFRAADEPATQPATPVDPSPAEPEAQ